MNDPVSGRTWVRSLSVGSAFLLVALLAARTSSSWIAVAFPDRPFARDLLFELLPHVAQLGYVADLAVVAAIALLLVYAFRGNQREIPAMMALYGMMEFTRALINLLTPLASPLHHSAYYGMSVQLEHALGNVVAPLASQAHKLAYFGISISNGVMHLPQNGEFPSGHMASVFLSMLLVDKAKSPRIRAAIAVLVVVECLALLMSHQHYSIDIVGGLLLSYFIYHEYAEGTWFNWLKPLVTV